MCERTLDTHDACTEQQQQWQILDRIGETDTIMLVGVTAKGWSVNTRVKKSTHTSSTAQQQ